MSFRLIHIPHDESTHTLREIEVQTLSMSSTRALKHQLFGDADVTIETVRPRGLQHLHDKANRRIFSFLVDEDGRRKELPFNTRASILYGTHVHQVPVLGDAFIIGEVQQMTSEGPDWVWQSVPAEITLAVISDAITEASRDTARFRP